MNVFNVVNIAENKYQGIEHMDGTNILINKPVMFLCAHSSKNTGRVIQCHHLPSFHNVHTFLYNMHTYVFNLMKAVTGLKPCF